MGEVGEEGGGGNVRPLELPGGWVLNACPPPKPRSHRAARGQHQRTQGQAPARSAPASCSTQSSGRPLPPPAEPHCAQPGSPVLPTDGAGSSALRGCSQNRVSPPGARRLTAHSLLGGHSDNGEALLSAPHPAAATLLGVPASSGGSRCWLEDTGHLAGSSGLPAPAGRLGHSLAESSPSSSLSLPVCLQNVNLKTKSKSKTEPPRRCRTRPGHRLPQCQGRRGRKPATLMAPWPALRHPTRPPTPARLLRDPRPLPVHSR